MIPQPGKRAKNPPARPAPLHGNFAANVNHLAHARLAGPEPLDIAANLMGDFVRGRLEGRFPPRVEAGIRLHRIVDSYTDQHPVHTCSRDRLEPPFRRYAGILVDMYYDHFLARHFDRFCATSLKTFTAHVYDSLERHAADLPRRLRVLARHWRREDLLAGYARLSVLEEALAGLSHRLRRDNPLARGMEPLNDHYRVLEADFLEFFPHVMRFAGEERDRLRARLGLNARTASKDHGSS